MTNSEKSGLINWAHGIFNRASTPDPSIAAMEEYCAVEGSGVYHAGLER